MRLLSGMRPRALATTAAVLLLLGLILIGLLTPEAKTPHTARAAGTLAADVKHSSREIPQVVRRVGRSVVTIPREGGVGSGVIYRADGVILTNQHVVEGAKQVTVEFADGRRTAGRVAAADAATDLAVVKVNRTQLPAARFATGLPAVGSTAIVLGSPLGFEKSVTGGIIPGTHRNIPGSAVQDAPLVDLLQTDAPVSPGNSGGALTDDAGQITGIVDAYIPPQQGAVAIGFAIPAPTVTRVAEDLLDDGQVHHAFLGVQPAQLTPELAGQLGVRQTSGVLIYQATPGGPAAAAGIRAGDVLLAIDGHRVETVEDLYAALRHQHVGQRVTVHYAHGDTERTVHAVLSDRPQ